MLSQAALAVLSALALTLAGAAFGNPVTSSVRINAGPLSSSLQDLERQTGIELLFDPGLVGERQSPAVRGDLTPEAALRQLLAGTDLVVRQARSGTWILERPDAAPLAQQDAEVAEILVIGRRTQNADIRRFEDDVQPYTVASREEILSAHRDNIGQFFSSRITQNTQSSVNGVTPGSDLVSTINLRGLGPDQTLVLIDGRRMPTAPFGVGGGFTQADVSALPLHAVQRIEVLTDAAGGIHGFGALGGVANIVLDRDHRGLDVHITEGISSRGDSHRRAVEASFGGTSHDGDTDFTLFVAHSQSDAPLVGERDFSLRDRLRSAQLSPDLYQVHYPHGNSITVFGTSNSSLVLKPGFGGGTLPSNFTFLPAGFSGDGEALAAALRQHAGQLDFSLPNGIAQTGLGPDSRSDALLVNLRRRFGSGFEAYADAVVLRNRGRAHDRAAHGLAFISAASPANPFTQDIRAAFPIAQTDERSSERVESTRYSAGILAELPFDWRGSAEASFGAFRLASSASTPLLGAATSLNLRGVPSDPKANPLGDWDAFQRALTQGRGETSIESALHTEFRDQSLRLAGPLLRTATRPWTATLLAEHRAERMPPYTEIDTIRLPGGTTSTDIRNAPFSSTTTSLYAELRSPLFDDAAPFPLLRDLELQFAIRRDDQHQAFERAQNGTESQPLHADFAGTAYTAGAKVSPTNWLMLRASYATGEQPPPVQALQEAPERTVLVPLASDPKRNGARLGTEGIYQLRGGGNADLRADRASTVFFGAALTPGGKDGPRLDVGLSRIRRTRDVLLFSAPDIMAHEDFWPNRVVRAPLTDVDRAKGYAAGRVLVLDTRAFNGAALAVDALDIRGDWPLMLPGSRLRLYADATHHMHQVRSGWFQPDVESAGYREGPLEWRANGGFDWAADRLTIGANMQYFGSYRVTQQDASDRFNDQVVQYQGAERVPSQVYLDLHATWRPLIRDAGPAHGLMFDFGIVNVLDAAPPRESALIRFGPGYSLYGDPRQRRFELTVSCHF